MTQLHASVSGQSFETSAVCRASSEAPTSDDARKAARQVHNYCQYPDWKRQLIKATHHCMPLLMCRMPSFCPQ